MQQLGDAQHEISMQLDRLNDADDKSKAEALALVCMFLGQGLPKAKHPVQFAESMERVVPLISSEAPEIRVKNFPIDFCNCCRGCLSRLTLCGCRRTRWQS